MSFIQPKKVCWIVPYSHLFIHFVFLFPFISSFGSFFGTLAFAAFMTVEVLVKQLESSVA